jgi:hypothetical protein
MSPAYGKTENDSYYKQPVPMLMPSILITPTMRESKDAIEAMLPAYMK